jgi:hypothetical protein
MDTSTEKRVEIAWFQYPIDARPLVALLESEGIDCYLKNEFSMQVMSCCADIGEVAVEVTESLAPRALKLMADDGYINCEIITGTRAFQSRPSWVYRLPYFRKLPLEIQIAILFLLLAVNLFVAIYFGLELLTT